MVNQSATDRNSTREPAVEKTYQDDEAALEALARGADPHVESPQSDKTQDDDQPGGGGSTRS